MNKTRLDALVMEQEGLDKLGRKEIQALQLEKLNKLLKKEKERGGFYSALPERLDSLDELSSLPFTTDEDLAGSASSMLLCSQSDIQRVLSDATSGTTGRAKRVFYTHEDCENTIRLFMAGLGELVFPGSVTMICMPFSGPYGLGELIAQAIERLGARPLKCGIGLSYGELSELLSREKPDSYVGMPVALLSMLRFCGKASLRRALISGDACPAVVVAECEKILGTRLFPHYGSREMGLGGAVCCPAHEGMHLRENHVIAEIVDDKGRALPKGEYGELVITTIGMEAMPLIRYRSGDYTRILPKPCPCGSELIRLDSLRRKNAAEEIQALDQAMFSLDTLLDYKACRREGALEVTALCTDDTSQDEILAALVSALPGTDFILHSRKACREDRALYFGKRKIE